MALCQDYTIPLIGSVGDIVPTYRRQNALYVHPNELHITFPRVCPPPAIAIIASSPRPSTVPSERIAPSSGHLRRSGGQSAQGTHQTSQRLPECGPASLVRRLADISQIVAGIPIVVARRSIFVSAAYASSAIGSGADAGPGLLQDAATMLLAVAINAPSG